LAAAKAKALMTSLPDDVLEKYLEAMPAKTAGKIINEFKTPEETSRIQKVLELMRKPPLAGAATEPSATVGTP
jgi:hypothetical protein